MWCTAHTDASESAKKSERHGKLYQFNLQKVQTWRIKLNTTGEKSRWIGSRLVFNWLAKSFELTRKKGGTNKTCISRYPSSSEKKTYTYIWRSMKAKKILGARISCLHDAREPSTFGKKEIGQQSLDQGNGNFLTGSNSFVLKENNPLNQFQMYSEVLFLSEMKHSFHCLFLKYPFPFFLSLMVAKTSSNAHLSWVIKSVDAVPKCHMITFFILQGSNLP